MPDVTVLVAILGSGIGIYVAALALGIRHGIDWDHIAAITDITSTTAPIADPHESWLMSEPELMLNDQSHHFKHSHLQVANHKRRSGGAEAATLLRLGPSQVEALWLGTLYALGHGLVVTLLGIVAIVASEFLPDWVDPIMEKLVGVTLILLAIYLFFSIYHFFRRGGEFRIRSRWMLVFSGLANAWHWARSHLGEHEHRHTSPQQYGARTAFGIGLIHGIGAETGTQALIIATAVGASGQDVAIATLLVFVGGLLISNSFVTVVTTLGFVSAQRRQGIYVAVGIFAALFSLLIGVAFVTDSAGVLPGLDPYFRWLGGPET